MQCNNLWAVDNYGAVYSLNIKTRQWTQLNYQRLEFKRLSSSPLSIWAIGGDHQIYIYVPSTEIPIRVCALTYENQRWNPLSQFSSTLLPTDRPQFSCADGTLNLPKESFQLPSKSWQWESDWYVDTNIEGEPLGPEGWTYAIDFPMKFGSERRWNSLVRRRRWLRFRRYVSVNQWALLESIHGDFVTEPFIDIATGGYDIPGGNQDCLAVWAVTVIGRVMFRKGVEKLSPEGQAWINIEVPTGSEVNQISCGPTGLTWAVAWDGSALVRLGVNRDSISGNSWLRVGAPNESKLMQISVGCDAVWAITRDGKVWFRKGVRGLNCGHNDASATGSGWVEMMHQMSILSVTANDQVWALGSDRRCIYFRTGISYGELTGKSWKLVSRLPINVANTKSSSEDKSLNQQLDNISISSEDSCFSSQLQDNDNCAWIWISASSCTLNTDLYLQSGSSSLGSQASLTLSNNVVDNSIVIEECEWRSKILSLLHDRFEREMKDFQSTYQRAVESGTWVKSGTCYVAKEDKIDTNWCLGLLELERQGAESTTESGTLTVSYSSSSNQTLSPSMKAKLKKTVLNLAEVLCVYSDCCDRGPNFANNCLVIITDNCITKLKFRSETELDDWLATLNMVCGDLHGINGTTATFGAIAWFLTQKGDVYVGHQTSNKNIFYYHLCGGHFQQVTTSSRVCWALSYDGVLWVFNNGYGGGVYRGITGANSNCHSMTDTIFYYCYENQRWNPLMGFAPKGLPTDRYMWSDETGKQELTKDSFKLPSKNWQWITDWNIDYSLTDGVDSDGWQYAIDFPFDYHSDRKFTDYVRRRRWYRKCKLTTTGPWTDLSAIPIICISIRSPKTDSKTDGETIIHSWAISADGDALCRLGVSSMCPRGLSWQHVPCEQPFVNVSVGGHEGSIRVWAIARDGSAFLRHGISQGSPSGTVWFHIEPPRSQCPLKQICVGMSTVWAIDAKNRLWFREEIVATFPEGTHWKKVDDNVIQISVDNCDQVWAIIRRLENDSLVKKFAKRTGITCDNRIGTDWQIVNKYLNCLQYICTVNNHNNESNSICS